MTHINTGLQGTLHSGYPIFLEFLKVCLRRLLRDDCLRAVGLRRRSYDSIRPTFRLYAS